MSDTYTEDEISLIDILRFLQDSIGNVIKSVLACVVLGGVYFFSKPNIYEATATIQMAMASGEPVEAPAILLEKLKLPLYFSQKVWNACDTNEELTPSRKVSEKIKPLLNKSAPFIGFSVQSPSLQEATECLNAVIFDISAKQAELAKPILDQKKLQITQLEEKLKLAEETATWLKKSQQHIPYQRAVHDLMQDKAVWRKWKLMNIFNRYPDAEGVFKYLPRERREIIEKYKDCISYITGDYAILFPSDIEKINMLCNLLRAPVTEDARNLSDFYKFIEKSITKDIFDACI